MKIYKYRDFSTREFLSDILKKERLYCARYEDLNDPFEGILNTSRIKKRVLKLHEEESIDLFLKKGYSEPVIRHDWEPIIDFNTLSKLDPSYDRTRVCSLSRSNDDVRLWSLYADSHRGCAVEIDIERCDGLYPVRYITSLTDIPIDKAVVLLYKSKHWSFEKEVRFVTSSNFISVKQKICSIQVGLRTTNEDIDFLLGIAPSYTQIFLSELDNHAIRITRGRLLIR
jgi:hypothetical protein